MSNVKHHEGINGLFVVSERKRLGLKQKQLAEMLGITPRQLCRIESNKQGGSCDVLVKLYHIFGCSFEDLLGVESNKKGDME